MAALGDAAPFATGDPTICKGCGACLSAVSILKPARAEGENADMEGIYDWTCEFCGEVNRAELDDMEKPAEGLESVDYVLEAAPVPAMSAVDGKAVAGKKVKTINGRNERGSRPGSSRCGMRSLVKFHS